MSDTSMSGVAQQRSDALERVSDGVVALTDELQCTYVDTPAAALLETDAESLLGERLGDAFPDHGWATAQNAIERAIETGQRTSFEWHNQESSERWEGRVHSDDTGTTILFNKSTQIVGSARDTTDRKDGKQRLQKFEQIVEHTGHAVFFTGVDGRMEYVNPAFERLTGYTAAEALGKTPHVLSSGEHDDAFFADLWETVLDGDVWRGEIVNERKDGTRFVVNHTIAPVTDESGDVTHFAAIYDDITDRKECEAELRRKTRTLDKAPVGITIADPSQEDEPLTYVNEAFTETTGYDEDEAVGRNCRFLQGQGTDPAEVAKLRDTVDAAEQIDVTLRNYRKDGTAFWNQLAIAPVRDRDGDLERFVGFQRDVTEQHERQQEIQTHLLQAQEIGQIGSWQLEIDTNELEWSDECYRIFGVEPGTAMTKERFLKMVHPEDRTDVNEAWEQAVEHGRYDIEHRVVVDGETRWVHETAEVEYGSDGEPETGIGVVQDITEQVQQTREIRAQKRRYESLFNNVSGAVVVTDLDGCIQTCNPGFTDLFKYDSDDVEGKHIGKITESGADVERLLGETDAAGDSLLINCQKSSGQVFPGESRISPLRTDDGEIHGRVIHIVDVSDAQENREQLQVLGRVLRHNIRNSMTVIMGHAEHIEEYGSAMAQSDAGKILETSKKFVELAENQHRIVKLLTNNAENIERDLVPITRGVVTDLQRQYPDAKLQTDLAASCRASTTGKIAAAIRELVQNAISHSDQEQPSVDIQLRCTETVAELTIRDDGPGMPEQEWSVLTERGEINALNHGTGLGLWYVNQIVRQANGTLAFHTNDPKGTTVTVHLPTG